MESLSPSYYCASFVDFPLQLNALALLFVIALGQVITQYKDHTYTERSSISLPVMCALIIVTTLIGPNVFSGPSSSTVLQSLESQAAHHPLDPTVLEQVLWMKSNLWTQSQMMHSSFPHRDTRNSRENQRSASCHRSTCSILPKQH